MLGWLGNPEAAALDADVKITIISPATDVHVRKARTPPWGQLRVLLLLPV